jgi:hypothetical protein
VGFRGFPHCGQGFPSGAWWVSGGFPTVGRGFLGISFRCLAGLRGFSYFRALFVFILFVFDFFGGFSCFVFVYFVSLFVSCVSMLSVLSSSLFVFGLSFLCFPCFFFSVIHLVCGLPTSC